MKLTNQEIQVILEIIDAVSIPVKQSREVVEPIVNKLRIMTMSNQDEEAHILPDIDPKEEKISS